MSIRGDGIINFGNSVASIRSYVENKRSRFEIVFKAGPVSWNYMTQVLDEEGNQTPQMTMDFFDDQSSVAKVRRVVFYTPPDNSDYQELIRSCQKSAMATMNSPSRFNFILIIKTRKGEENKPIQMFHDKLSLSPENHDIGCGTSLR